jgi:hypothetical protein
MSASTADRTGSLTRRRALAALALAAGTGTVAASAAAPARRDPRGGRRQRQLSPLAATLPIADPAFNVRVMGRLQGDLSGRTIYSFVTGRVFGLVPGEGPPLSAYGRLLYRTDGVAVQMSRLRADGSVEERSRKWSFYKDPETGAYLGEFRNPYTGETLPVPPFRGGITGGVMTADGPEITASFAMESSVFGRPMLLDWRFIGEQAFIYRHAFTRWKEPSTGFHKTEMTLDAWVCRIEDVADDSLTMIPSVYSWTSQTEWQSWLRMRGHPGAMLWRQERVAFEEPAALPREFVEHSEKRLPGALAEPLSWS